MIFVLSVGKIPINPVVKNAGYVLPSSFFARSITGMSTICPSIWNTGEPFCSYSVKTFSANSSVSAEGRNISLVTATCLGWMQSMPPKPMSRQKAVNERRPSLSEKSGNTVSI